MTDIERLEKLCAGAGLAIRVMHNNSCTHVQVRGAVLVNWYPDSRRRTMYINGMVRGVDHASVEQIVKAARGEGFPNMPEKERRLAKYTRHKRAMFRKHPFCYWCKKPVTLEESTCDHKIPLSKGGLNHRNNYCLACWPCNQARGNSMPTMDMPYAPIQEKEKLYADSDATDR